VIHTKLCECFPAALAYKRDLSVLEAFLLSKAEEGRPLQRLRALRNGIGLQMHITLPFNMTASHFSMAKGSFR